MTPFGKPDLTVKEVQSPNQNWCSSGHVAPKKFARQGPKHPEEATKFFQVACDEQPRVNGVYCEPCLIIANAIERGEVRVNRR